jgi:hypothetical protein
MNIPDSVLLLIVVFAILVVSSYPSKKGDGDF